MLHKSDIKRLNTSAYGQHNSCTATCRHLCKAPEWTSSLTSGGQGQCPWERPTTHNSGLIGQAILCVWLIMPVRCEVKHNGVWQPPDSNGLQKMKSMWLCKDKLLELPLSGLSSIQLLIPRGLRQTNWLKLPQWTNARFYWRRKISSFKTTCHQDKRFLIHASWVTLLQKKLWWYTASFSAIEKKAGFVFK